MSADTMQALKKKLKFVRRVVYLLAPPVLLFLILRRIDFPLFMKRTADVNLWLLLLGLSYYPAVVLVSGLRWKVTLSAYFHLRPPLRYLVRHYWIGMALGFFSPGQLGLDAYRVLVIGRRYRHYMQMVFAVFIEKMMALLNAVLLVLCLYPFVKQFIVRHDSALDRVLNVSYLVGLASLVLGGLVLAAARHRLAHQVANTMSAVILRFINRMKGTLETKEAARDAGDPNKVLELLSNPRPFALVFAASLAIQFVSAVGNQIIFRAVGYEIPFAVNLFVTPIFYFIFLIPISFGSLGVREGAYILLYGAFGVPAEVALLVSFINLSGILFNNAVGAAMIWFARGDKSNGPGMDAGQIPTTGHGEEES